MFCLYSLSYKNGQLRQRKWKVQLFVFISLQSKTRRVFNFFFIESSTVSIFPLFHKEILKLPQPQAFSPRAKVGIGWCPAWRGVGRTAWARSQPAQQTPHQDSPGARDSGGTAGICISDQWLQSLLRAWHKGVCFLSGLGCCSDLVTWWRDAQWGKLWWYLLPASHLCPRAGTPGSWLDLVRTLAVAQVPLPWVVEQDHVGWGGGCSRYL